MMWRAFFVFCAGFAVSLFGALGVEGCVAGGTKASGAGGWKGRPPGAAFAVRALRRSRWLESTRRRPRRRPRRVETVSGVEATGGDARAARWGGGRRRRAPRKLAEADGARIARTRCWLAGQVAPRAVAGRAFFERRSRLAVVVGSRAGLERGTRAWSVGAHLLTSGPRPGWLPARGRAARRSCSSDAGHCFGFGTVSMAAVLGRTVDEARQHALLGFGRHCGNFSAPSSKHPRAPRRAAALSTAPQSPSPTK